MFGLGDDFEIDENFLDEVFEAEKACITNASKINKTSHGSTSREQSLPLTAKTNLEDTKLNILPDHHSAVQHSFTLDTSRFRDSPSLGIDSPRLDIDSPNLHTPLSNRTSNVVTPIQGSRNVSDKGSSSRKVRTRKFPGPAGLLPERQGNSSLIATDDFLNEIEQELNQENQYKEEVVLSQESARNLESPAWGELIKDLGHEGRNLMKTLNVASVCSRAKQTRALKVPFIALLINNIDASTADPCLYLSDSTGNIVGAVHREVWEHLSSDLIAGTVIVLINVGVLCAGNTTSRHYLNITTNNIAAIYSPTKGSDIRVTNMKSISQPDCTKFLQTWQSILLTPAQPPQPQTQENRQLFSTANISPFPPLKRPFSKSLDNSFSRTPSLDSPIRLNRNIDRYSLDSSPISRPNQRFDSNNSFSNRSQHNDNLLVSSNNFSRNSSNVSNRFSQNRINNPRNHSIQSTQSNNKLPQNPYHNNRISHYDNKMPQKSVINNVLPQVSSISRGQSNFQAKRPKFDGTSSNIVSMESQGSEVDRPSIAASQSIVESELDGVDTESLFDDF